ncbi:hypothetical protein ACKWTF_011625 [Chironomus riparius]
MTLINSCWPNSFSHLIILLSTITTISTNHLYQDAQRETTDSLTAPLVSRKTLTEAVGDQRATTFIGYDHRRIDNKRYDNLFDFKTDVNNLLFHSHDILMSSTRKRRNVNNDDVNDTGTKNLILNLSNANFTNLNILNVNISTSNVIALNLSNNILSTLNVSKFYNLTSLDLSHNRFSEFKVNGHEHLKALDLSSNLLKNFSCIKCECLETLNLSRNLITTIDGESFDNLINLNFLDLSSNQLSVIDPTLFRNKSNLSDVVLSCNRISVINKDIFFQLPSLRRLDLSHNDISDVVNDAFSDLTSLQILDLSFNRIHIASLQTIQNIAQLARLSIAGNVMLKNALRAFAVTWSIMELDYSHVGLCQVPDSLAQSVRILNLYGNFLNIIASGDFESYPFLHKLILSQNNLSSIEEDALGRLELLTILHLDHNKLTQIPSSLPSSLIKLYMQNNRIMELNSNDLMNLINLQVLDLSNNKIIYMPQLTLPALLLLSVRYCGLENIHRSFMKTSPNLRHLLIDGNLIKCSQLVEIEQCYDAVGVDVDDENYTLTNEYINDNIDYNQNDAERTERHLNSISYFPHDGGYRKCGQWNESSNIHGETVPNCWNEQKLITSFTRTNDSSDERAAVPNKSMSIINKASESKTFEKTSTTNATNITSNDNKFRNMTKESLKVKNDGNLSNETMTINKTIANDTHFYEQHEQQPENQQSKMKSSDKMKNLKASEEDEDELMKKAKLAHPVNVVKTKIKALNNNESINTNNGNKNLSLVSVDAHKQKINGGLNNLILMKTKHFKSSSSMENGSLITNGIQLSMSNVDYVHNNNNNNNGTTIINRNLIVDNNSKKKVGKATTTFKSDVVGVHSTTTNKVNAIKDNGMENIHYVAPATNNKSKSIDGVNRLNDNSSSVSGNSNKGKSRYGHYNDDSENRPSLNRGKAFEDGNNNSGNENIEATDHQQQKHIMTINHTMNGEKSEHWSDIRRNENISSHPGLLIVLASSVGVLFTFITVYVYRCNFINSSRRRVCRRNGSCEHINEGRDALNDNFNEEIRSFTIETHNQCMGSVNNGEMTTSSTVNHCDLLPMDVLNSTLNQSHVDRTNISMHFW